MMACGFVDDCGKVARVVAGAEKSGGFLTPKAIGNRIKAKGLTKLRWYCQMCQKACRDENGFKCHCLSESHRRQMLMFQNNPNRFMDDFSRDFHKNFVETLSHRHGTKRCKAITIYNEMIADRHHVHMNSTTWVTLTQYVKYLGREGICKVDQDEDGKWYIAWIDKDPKALARAAAREKAEAMELTEQERQSKMLQRQIEAMKKLESSARSRSACATGGEDAADGAEDVPTTEDEERVSEDDDGYEDFDDDDLNGIEGGQEDEELVHDHALSGAPVVTQQQKTAVASHTSVQPKPSKHVALIPRGTVAFSLTSKAAVTHSGSGSKPGAVFGSDGSSDDGECEAAPAASTAKRQMSAVERIASEIQEKKRREDVPNVINMRGEKFKRRENWLVEGIVVKIMDKELAGGQFYKAKAYVRSLVSSFIAEVKTVESSHVIKIDQRDLETVLPAAGGPVIIVNGPHSGLRGTLKEIHVGEFCCDVLLKNGTLLRGVEYEDVCKLMHE